MEAINTEEYLNKIRARREQSGLPRCERDELLDLFLARLNAEQIKDGYPKLTYARLAKKLQGIRTAELYPLFKRCESYRSFGAGLNHQLKERATEGQGASRCSSRSATPPRA